jgi:hypothetical protein
MQTMRTVRAELPECRILGQPPEATPRSHGMDAGHPPMADDETVLREKARGAIRQGKLPCHRPARIWSGLGVDVGCAVCEQPVRRYELEVELQFERNSTRAPGLDNFQIHARCFAAWEFERMTARPDPPLRPDGTHTDAARGL